MNFHNQWSARINIFRDFKIPFWKSKQICNCSISLVFCCRKITALTYCSLENELHKIIPQLAALFLCHSFWYVRYLFETRIQFFKCVYTLFYKKNIEIQILVWKFSKNDEELRNWARNPSGWKLTPREAFGVGVGLEFEKIKERLIRHSLVLIKKSLSLAFHTMKSFFVISPKMSVSINVALCYSTFPSTIYFLAWESLRVKTRCVWENWLQNCPMF